VPKQAHPPVFVQGVAGLKKIEALFEKIEALFEKNARSF